MFYFYWIISVYYFSTVYVLSWQQMTIPSDVNYTSLKRFPAGLSKLSRVITYIILTIIRCRKYNFDWIRVSFPPMQGTITGERSFRYRFGTNQIHKTPNERDLNEWLVFGECTSTFRSSYIVMNNSLVRALVRCQPRGKISWPYV